MQDVDNLDMVILCAIVNSMGSGKVGKVTNIQTMVALIDGDKELSEAPSSKRRPMPRSLDDYQNREASRNDAIVQAYASGGYTLKEIGDHFDLHYSTVSGIIKNHKSKT